ncbi:MAG: TfoX/Sxy family DNA transformation protein [Pseudomonadota bacterium]
MNNQAVNTLTNIGKTVASRLHEIDVQTRADLETLGAARAYKRLSEQNPSEHLPVCYYLYSLEGALQDRHWDDFSEDEKLALRLQAGLSK